jgi:thymidylate kinase
MVDMPTSRCSTNKQGYFVLAGPQCAGKSTVKSYLYARFMTRRPGEPHPRNLVLLQEMRQLVMHEHGIHSAIFIDSCTECEIVERDLARMDDILRRADERLYLDETNVFTLAHASRRGLDTAFHLAAYVERLKRLDAAVLFFDLAPALSWSRREARYNERVKGFPRSEADVVLNQYRRYLDEVDSCLSMIRASLPVDIVRIDASRSTEDTLSRSAEVFVALARARGVEFCKRF